MPRPPNTKISEIKMITRILIMLASFLIVFGLIYELVELLSYIDVFVKNILGIPK